MREFINALIKNRKPLLIGLGLLAVVGLWLGNSLFNLVHNKLEAQKLARQNVELDREYEQLLQQKALLEAQDPALIEQIARTEYDLAKPGEIEFRFTVEK